MIVTLNDKNYDVKEGISLQQFIEQLEISPDGTAIAINYQVIPKTQWDKTILENNQELMLIRAVSGG